MKKNVRRPQLRPRYKVSRVRMIVQPRKKRSVDPAEIRRRIEAAGDGDANGVYAFGLRVSKKRTRPIWIGRATRQGFANECSSDHAMSKVREGLLRDRGTPVLFLVPVGKRGHGKANSRGIAALENKFIGMAYLADPQALLNRYGIRHRSPAARDGRVGFPRGGPTTGQAFLKRMLRRRR